jgi:hypothetical protein
VLVSGEKALQLGLQLIAKIKGFAEAAQVPYRIWFIFSLLVSGEKAVQLGLQLIAKIKGFADATQVPCRIWFIFDKVLD